MAFDYVAAASRLQESLQEMRRAQRNQNYHRLALTLAEEEEATNAAVVRAVLQSIVEAVASDVPSDVPAVSIVETHDAVRAIREPLNDSADLTGQ